MINTQEANEQIIKVDDSQQANSITKKLNFLNLIKIILTPLNNCKYIKITIICIKKLFL